LAQALGGVLLLEQGLHRLLDRVVLLAGCPVACFPPFALVGGGGEETTPWGGPRRGHAPVFCRACLAQHPEATLGQRIRAYHLAAGLTLKALGEQTGIATMQRGD
jgi:hypothetical protein